MKISKLAKDGYLKAEPRTHGGSNDDNIIDFSASINPFGASKRVYKAIKDNLHLISRYPDPEANMLRDAISNYLNIDREHIIIGNGSNEIIHLFADVFIKENDRVIIPEPTFYEYEFACDKNSAEIEFIELDAIDSIEFNGVKALFICNPNNPTGLLYDDRLLKKRVEEAYDNDTLVMIDECFIEFVDEPSRHSMIKYVDQFDNLIILRSFTKAFGLAGLRIGYAVANKELANILRRARITWNTNALAQIAAVEALNDLEHIEESKAKIKREKRYLINAIERLGLKPYESTTNFFLVKCNDSIELTKRLLEYNILVRDCSNFTNMKNDHIRVSVRKRKDNLILVKALSEINE